MKKSNKRSKFRLKVEAEVTVISGPYKSKTGKITSVNKKDNTVIVSGINMRKKAVKPSEQNPEGGIIDVEGPIHVSNVKVITS